MKVIYSSENTYLLRLQRGEEAIEKILEFCTQNQITAAWVQGLGAVDEANISYYDLSKREYVSLTFAETMELTNLTGNIATVDGKPMLHAHVTLSRSDYTTIGGHVQFMKISGTGEIYITKLNAAFTREFDEETGLKLLKS